MDERGVIDTHDPTYGWVSELGVLVCDRCQALITRERGSQKGHTEWHRKIDAMFQDWAARQEKNS